VDPFVTIEWLTEHRDEVVVADVRFYLDGRPGSEGYEAGHIPGAVYVEMRDVLAAPHQDDSAGRHPLPTPERFAAGLAAAGIADGDTVVAYDDAGGVMAARLVWMLRVTSHQAALLDGGLKAWPADELSTEPPPDTATTKLFTPVAWPADRLVEIAEVARLSSASPAGPNPHAPVLTDARPADRYAGAPDQADPQAGHIPGARSLSARGNLDADGRLLPDDQLKARFNAVGLAPGREFVSSCGSGVTACHNLLVHEHLGLGAGKLYVGSWSEWSRDPQRPIATGPDDFPNS
jgi:thiosulfate/3-mercaptopyruvate sulfurtransferase